MDDFLNTNQGHSALNAIRVVSPRYKARADIVKTSPFGSNSIFSDNVQGPFEDDFSINCQRFDLLLSDIVANRDNDCFWFDYNDYNQSLGYINTAIPIPSTFFYKDEDGHKRSGEFIIHMNKRIGEISFKDWTFSFMMEKKWGTIAMEISFYYDGTAKYRKNALDTENPDDFRIHDRFKALKIGTNDADAFVAFVKNVLQKQGVKERVKEQFLAYYKIINTAPDLNYFYKLAPQFVIQEIGKELLWQDLITLLEYDSDGWFSWLKDSSNGMLNIVKAFCKTDPGIAYLYKQFDQDQAKVKSIYEHLQGNSFYEDQQLPNKTIFAALITALTDLQITQILEADSTDKKHPRDRTDVLFKLTKGYRVDSNIAADDESDETFVLIQQRMHKEERSYTAYPTGGSSGGQSGTYDHIEWPIEQVYSLHPMDIVMVELSGPFGSPMIIPLPAIYVKDVAYHEEWELVMQIIRLAVNILIIVISVLTIASGAGLLLTTLAWIDLGLAVGDITVQVFESELRKTEWGREFLELWDKIYLVGGIVTGAPLLGNLLVNGAKALARIANAEARVQLVGMLKAALTSAENFPKYLNGKFEIIVDFAKEFKKGVFVSNLEKLYAEGVLLIKGILKGDPIPEYYLIYGEKLLSSGNLDNIIFDVSQIIKTSGSKLVDKIVEFLWLLRKERTMVNTSAKIGEELTEQTVKWGTVKMKLHPRYTEILAFIEERGIKINWIDDVTKDVGYTETKIFDKSGERLLRVEKSLDIHPEMRFLDLEHEIDHVLQFENILKGEFCTFMQRELGNNRLPSIYSNKNKGLLSSTQREFLEYEVRIREFMRLKDRNVAVQLLDEHLEGLKDIYGAFQEELRKIKYSSNEIRRFIDWKTRHFPDFKDFDFTTN